MIIREDISDHKIIIGCVRDSLIHIGENAFQLLASGLFDKTITLDEAKFMAACDVGPQWAALSEQIPIFGIDENGSPCFIKGGLVKPKLVCEPVSLEREVVTGHMV